MHWLIGISSTEESILNKTHERCAVSATLDTKDARVRNILRGPGEQCTRLPPGHDNTIMLPFGTTFEHDIIIVQMTAFSFFFAVYDTRPYPTLVTEH